jgi:hypothetical protein
MGIRNALRLIESGQQLNTSAPSTGIVSPWQTGQLNQVVWSDIFGVEAAIVNRTEAMSIPAVAKGRQILVSQLAKYPLRAYDKDAELTTQPEWLQGTSGDVSPWHRMAWTVDDLMFFGWSLWGVERDEAGTITRADRCPIERWEIDNGGEIRIDGQTAEADSVILIPGPFEGLLQLATRTLKGAAKLENSWVGKATNPIPAIELHQTTDDPLEYDEVVSLVQAWADARADVNGAIAFTPYNIQANALGQAEPSLLIEGRNFLRIDIGAFLGIPASLMDASLSTASLTYSTSEGQRNEFADFTLPYWLEPIQHRLSLDDVVPTGQRVRFDLSDLLTTTPSPTGPPTED